MSLQKQFHDALNDATPADEISIDRRRCTGMDSTEGVEYTFTGYAFDVKPILDVVKESDHYIKSFTFVNEHDDACLKVFIPETTPTENEYFLSE